MSGQSNGVLTGAYYLDGDHACSEGAIAAGCNFVAGYPITPSTEIVERLAARFPHTGGMFIQMEDEIASSIAIQGAVWGGAKAMTVSSGPGISLMMEHIGLAAMAEVPCVIVNVQRGGPSTGLPTLPAQADMMQARWGSHGDYEVIALAPNGPQECFDLVIHAFNLSEQYRVPVLFMMDEVVGHMTEKVVIPPRSEISITPRRYTQLPPGEYQPYAVGPSMVPEMVKAGEGYRFHISGLTHDERGYPTMNAAAQDTLVRRLCDKIRLNAEQIAYYHTDELEGADVVVVSYGITSRVCMRAIREARDRGVKVGHLRLVVVWPFPEFLIRRLGAEGEGAGDARGEPGAGQPGVGAVCGRSVRGSAGGRTPAGRCTIPRSSSKRFWRPRNERAGPLWTPVSYRTRLSRFCGPTACRTSGARVAVSAPTVNCFARPIEQCKLDLDKLAIVSGIGCTGRVAGYLNLDSFHTTHGPGDSVRHRLEAWPNPDLKVVVYSGDGDLIAIGGNHFIHAARRNADLTIICVNNFNYAMTGGQAASTTPIDAVGTTAPYGCGRDAVQFAVPRGVLRGDLRGAVDGLPRAAS